MMKKERSFALMLWPFTCFPIGRQGDDLQENLDKLTV
jgi:hypothetical protein